MPDALQTIIEILRTESALIKDFQAKPDTSLSFSYADTDAHSLSLSSVPVAGIIFYLPSGNTGGVYLGGTSVDTNSLYLSPGERFSFTKATNLNLWGYRFAAGSSGSLKILPILYV